MYRTGYGSCIDAYDKKGALEWFSLNFWSLEVASILVNFCTHSPVLNILFGVTIKKPFELTKMALIASMVCLVCTPLHSRFQQGTPQKTKYEFKDKRVAKADSLSRLDEKDWEAILNEYEKAYQAYEEEEFFEGMVYASS